MWQQLLQLHLLNKDYWIFLNARGDSFCYVCTRCCSQRSRMNIHTKILTKVDLISNWSHSIESDTGLLVRNMLTVNISCKSMCGSTILWLSGVLEQIPYVILFHTHPQSLQMHSHAFPHPSAHSGCTQWVCSTSAMTTIWYNATSASSSHDLPRPIRQ